MEFRCCAIIVTIITICLMLESAKASKRLILGGDEDVIQALATLQTEVGTLKTEVSTLKSALSAATSSITGSTYTRWGRTICPGNGSELIYHGYMAGSKYNEGGSAKSLCLPANPMWNHFADGHGSVNSYISTIYGTEIDIELGMSNALFGKNVNEQDVPCAVCQSSRSAQIMFPARTKCYDGWTEEYAGYIVAGHVLSQSGVDYVCLDEHLEFVIHGESNNNEHIIHATEVECGSLPCPPYINGRELACVVCTK